MIVTIPLEIYDGNGKLLGFELAEEHVRDWFKKVDLAQARDTLNVCEGICEMRLEAQPKRARAATKSLSPLPLIGVNCPTAWTATIQPIASPP